MPTLGTELNLSCHCRVQPIGIHRYPGSQTSSCQRRDNEGPLWHDRCCKRLPGTSLFRQPSSTDCQPHNLYSYIVLFWFQVYIYTIVDIFCQPKMTPQLGCSGRCGYNHIWKQAHTCLHLIQSPFYRCRSAHKHDDI